MFLSFLRSLDLTSIYLRLSYGHVETSDLFQYSNGDSAGA